MKEKKKVKKEVYVLPTTLSEVVTLQYPDDIRYEEVEKKFESEFARRFATPAFDFKKVGSSENLNWYVGIGSEYSEAHRAEVVVPEVYANAVVALKEYGDDKYCLVVLPFDRMTYFIIGKTVPILVQSFDFGLNSMSVEEIANNVEHIIDDFRRITFPALEVEKTLIVSGNIMPEKLRAFVSPEVVTVDPNDYDDSLNLNPKHSVRNKFSFNKLVLKLPVVGRKAIVLASIFLLYFSWLFPARSLVLYGKHIFDENNTQLQANIAELQTTKQKIQGAIDELRKQQELVKQWQQAAQSVKKVDVVAVLSVIYKNPNVQGVRMENNSISIDVTANSPSEIDSYVKMLIDSGYFKGFNAPQRKKGTTIYNLVGDLNV
jgi:hypothetical protein